MAQTLKLARLDSGAEIFHTLQGEGVSVGTPAVFIRASLCNLHCQWCDTDYTWNWENTPWKHENDALPGYQKFRKEEHIVELPVEEIAQQVMSYNCHRLILTGGEPLLQCDGWVGLLDLLSRSLSGLFVEVETNGTQVPTAELNARVHQYNVSPKLSNSGNPQELREVEKALRFFAESGKAWFKFVITEESDLEEVLEMIARHSIPRDRVLLMPEGRDEETLSARRLWLAELCRDRGFRYCERLHIQLWGSRRGV